MILGWLVAICVIILPICRCTQFVPINASTCTSNCGSVNMTCDPREIFLLSTDILACFNAVLQMYPHSTLVSHGYNYSNTGKGCQAKVDGDVVTVTLFKYPYFCNVNSTIDQDWFIVCPCTNASVSVHFIIQRITSNIPSFSPHQLFRLLSPSPYLSLISPLLQVSPSLLVHRILSK